MDFKIKVEGENIDINGKDVKAIRLNADKVSGVLEKRGYIFFGSQQKYRKLLKFEADVKIGSVTGELVEYKSWNKIKPFTNLNIFFLGLSNRWGSEERNILKDCTLALELVLKFIFIHIKILCSIGEQEKFSIECFFHQGKLVTKVFKWHKLRKAVPLKELNVNIVHCYDIKLLRATVFYAFDATSSFSLYS